jgi:dTDP-4-dehydrorhamnose 3,5-epimerase
MPFTFERTELPDVLLITPKVFGDERGFFMETYRREAFRAAGIEAPLVQENHSRSAAGILRGLHYQRQPKPQGKLVRAVRGAIYDVAVDIRPESPTFGRWVGVTLTEENRQLLYVPPGFAHGFCVVADVAEVIYLTTEEYAPELEHGVPWNDPSLAIPWPVAEPTLSARDRAWPPFGADILR